MKNSLQYSILALSLLLVLGCGKKEDDAQPNSNSGALLKTW